MNNFRSNNSMNKINQANYKTTEIDTKYEQRCSTIQDLCSDIWEQIFEYFEVMDVFKMFASFTDATNEVLYNKNYRCLFRGLTIDPDTNEVPQVIPLNGIISMTLYENDFLKTVEYYSALRSLKLVGKTEWILSIIKTISLTSLNLNQLTIIIPIVKTLSEILTPVLSICSLRRLEIRTDVLTESVEVCPLLTTTSNIEQFILDLGTIINWNELAHVLASLNHCYYFSISVIHRNQILSHSLLLHNLRSLHIGLVEVPFNCIIQLVETTTCLVKLKITGLVDSDGFVINQRWLRLFETASSLSRIFVCVSLEQSHESYHYEEIQTPLRALNLSLVCDSDDAYCCSYYGYSAVSRWWNLSGMIIRPTTCK